MRTRSVRRIAAVVVLAVATSVPYVITPPNASAAGTAPGAPSSLTVNGLSQPLGTTASDLTFGWIVNDTDRGEVQTAYEVIVATSQSDIASGTGSVWDSGKVTSDESVAVSYGGPALASATRYYWAVRTWDKDDLTSPYAATQWFETGLLNRSDWSAQWIQGAEGGLYRKGFTISKTVQSARLYVTAQGMYEARINGAKVGDQIAAPAWTEWEKRVLVQDYDVTSMLRSGANVVGMTLATGHYVLNWVQTPPRAIAQLVVTYSDGTTTTVGTDTSWKTAQGPLTSGSVGGGATATYTQSYEKPGWDSSGYDDSSWSAVTAPTDTITATLEPSMTTPQRVTGTLTGTVRSVANQTGRWVVDFGTNVSALPRVSITTTSPNQTVRVVYGERLDPSTGEVTGNLVETDYFVLSSTGTYTHAEQFDVMGFRYAEIYGSITTPTSSTVLADVVTDAVTRNQFSSSDAEINAIQAAQQQTRINTLHSVPEDNPNRERRGWGADSMVTADEALYDFSGLTPLYDKFMADVRSTQGTDGSVFDYNPNNDNNGGFSTDVAWASNLPMITWRTYQYNGDQRIVRQNYDSVHAWIAWVRANLNATTGLVDNSKAQLSHWGDWIATISTAPGPLLYTAIFYGDVLATVQMATLLGRTADATDLSTLAGQLADSIRANYQNTTTRLFGTEEVSNATALAFGLVPSADVSTVLTALVNEVAANNGHFAGGLLGQQLVFRALAMNGRSDLVKAYLDKTDHPSFGYMLANGPGTIWEDWEGTSTFDSLDQPGMGGGPGEWAFAYLAGIKPQQCAGQGGYHDVVLAPQIGNTTTSANATLQTVRGTLSSSWNLTSSTTLTWSVTVPVNSHATLAIPRPGGEAVGIIEGSTDIYDNGGPVQADAGLAYDHTDSAAVYFTAGSGTYTFTVGPATNNVALGKTVTVRSTVSDASWAPADLTDGILTSTATSQGYRSASDSSASQTEWATIDLGSSQSIRTVTLYPAHPSGSSGGYGFPVRFAIQVSDSPTFASYTTFADQTLRNYKNPGDTPQSFTGNATGRYIRVYVSRLASVARGTYVFALAEVTAQAAITTQPPLRKGKHQK